MAASFYPLVFGITLFISSALLFVVQPLIGKIMLPRLGGTPAVWNTALVFFQTILLAGYVYAHLLHKLPGKRWQLIWHTLFFALPFVCLLPLQLSAFEPTPGGDPSMETLWLLLVLVGLPGFLVASTAPLLQKWFADTDHPSAGDPYFLYAASNLGSLLALAAYPFWIERNWSVDEQNRSWAIGYGVLASCILICAFLAWRTAAPALTASPERSDVLDSSTGAVRPSWLRRLRWLALSAVPASLLMGLNATLTLDIAPASLLWVLPLALYLFTFVLAFARIPVARIIPESWLRVASLVHATGLLVLPLMLLAVPSSALREILGAVLVMLVLLLPYRWVIIAQPLAVLALTVLLVSGRGVLQWFPLSLHLLAFWLTARLCHGELARDRPAPRFLTEFYLWLALGGAVGGLFTVLVAPLVFQVGLVEYPLALVLGCALRPAWQRNGLSDGFWAVVSDLRRRRRRGSGWQRDRLALAFDLIIGVVGVAVTLAAFLWAEAGGSVREQATSAALTAEGDKQARQLAGTLTALGPPWLFCLVVIARPLRFALPLGALLLLHAMAPVRGQPYLFAGRSYFGLLKVQETWIAFPGDDPAVAVEESEGPMRVRTHVLVHGSTQHGMNFQKPADGVGADLSRLATAYFHSGGPVGDVLRRFDRFRGPLNTYWSDARLPASIVGSSALSAGAMPLPVGPLVGAWSEPPIGILGLGTGTLAAYGRPLQHVHFYEIDPKVIELSLPLPGEQRFFCFLEDARRRGVQIEVICGDGRLTLERQGPERFYKLLFMDAFSSNSIPSHLLTKEAMHMYFQKLADDGILCVNVTNRYLDLAPVAAAAAQSFGYCCLWARDTVTAPGRVPSDWVLVARSPKDFASFQGRSWDVPHAAASAWTDDFSDPALAVKDPGLRSVLTIMKVVLGLLLGLVLLLVLVESCGRRRPDQPRMRSQRSL